MSLSFISVLLLGCGQVGNKIIQKHEIFTTVRSFHIHCCILAFGIIQAVTNSSIYAVNKKKNFAYNGSHISQVELVSPLSKVCASTTL
jgi:hypothetical protein